jgi:hypothetical protein
MGKHTSIDFTGIGAIDDREMTPDTGAIASRFNPCYGSWANLSGTLKCSQTQFLSQFPLAAAAHDHCDRLWHK